MRVGRGALGAGVVMMFLVAMWVPVASAATISRTDPAGDVTAWAALFVPTAVCNDDAIDILHTSVSSVGSTVTFRQRVQDLQDVGRCGGMLMPREGRWVDVWMHGTALPSVRVSYQEVLEAGSVTSRSLCYRIGSSASVCGDAAGSVADDTITWVVPLPSWIDGWTYQDVFGIAQAESYGATASVLLLSDENQLPSFRV